MKISDAVAALLRELTVRGDVEVELRTPSDRCEKHPSMPRECPYCDLCEHGRNRYQDCRQCHVNDDQTWRTASVSDRELLDLQNFFSPVSYGPAYRQDPHQLRNYVSAGVGLMPLLIAELRKHRQSQGHEL